MHRLRAFLFQQFGLGQFCRDDLGKFGFGHFPGELDGAGDDRGAGGPGHDVDDLLEAFTDTGAVSVADGLDAAAGVQGGKHLNEDIPREGVGDQHITGTGQNIVTPHNRLAIGPAGPCPVDGVALFFQFPQGAFGGERPVHVQDAHRGPL